MTDVPKANAVVGQSGGPTAVINASLVGVIEETQKHPEIENIYGAIHAVAGMRDDQFVDLTNVSTETLDLVAATPSSSIASSRDKPDKEYCAQIIDVFKKRNIRYFFYIGGNDSAHTTHILNTMADQADFDIRAFHIPKTVDNDLLITDHCPGYGTASRFVALALIGDDLDNRALPGVKIDVIMGRDAGFLTAAAALGKTRDDDGPHLLYFPERPVSIDKFVNDVERVYRGLGRCVVAVSEGICNEEEIPWAKKLAEQTETDAFGNVQLAGTGALADFLAAKVKAKLESADKQEQDKLRLRVRADTFGYLQRSFPGIQSSVDVDEARRCGREAVKLAMEHDNGSVAIKRLGNGPNYGIELFRTELQSLIGGTKKMPDEFINTDGNGITDTFVEYAIPLVGELPKTELMGLYPRI